MFSNKNPHNVKIHELVQKCKNITLQLNIDLYSAKSLMKILNYIKLKRCN